MNEKKFIAITARDFGNRILPVSSIKYVSEDSSGVFVALKVNFRKDKGYYVKNSFAEIVEKLGAV